MKLVEGWQKWHKFWSTRLGALGVTVTSIFVADPNAAQTFWNNLPSDVKSLVPPQYMPFIGIGLFVVSMVARFVVQQKLRKDIQGNDGTSTEEASK